MISCRTNWAGNLTYCSSEVVEPTSAEEVADFVRSQYRVRTLGTRHCFNEIADTSGVHISLRQMNRIDPVDRHRNTVTLQGGARYGELCRNLDSQGYALPNMASLPHISVAGACATATHGSGELRASLAGQVSAIQIVNGRGEIVEISRDTDADIFPGCVVNLGALGTITRLTLDVEPTYQVRQLVYRKLPVDAVLAEFDAIQQMAASVSLFTDWCGDTINQLWLKKLASDDMEDEETVCGASVARSRVHPVETMGADPCTEQLGIPGPWFERLPHFRLEFTPSVGAELQSEYLVPRESFADAFLAISGLRERIAPLLLISEIRTVSADDYWMSPFYHQQCVGFHFTWKPLQNAVMALLPDIEAAIKPYNARPHWGKLFTMPWSEVRSHYPEFAAFKSLTSQFDPICRYRNGFLNGLLGTS